MPDTSITMETWQRSAFSLVFPVFAKESRDVSTMTLFVADDPGIEPFVPALEAIATGNDITINEVIRLGFEPDLTGPISAADTSNDGWLFVLADGAQCTASAAATATVGYEGSLFANDLCAGQRCPRPHLDRRGGAPPGAVLRPGGCSDSARAPSSPRWPSGWLWPSALRGSSTSATERSPPTSPTSTYRSPAPASIQCRRCRVIALAMVVRGESLPSRGALTVERLPGPVAPRITRGRVVG